MPSETVAAEGRGAFGGFVGPRTLLAQVEVAAPFLFDGSLGPVPPRGAGARVSDHAQHALGWWSCLLAADLLPAADEPTAAQRTDYFALCLAAHFASAATYVPTDVDAKIRHALWFEPMPDEERARMRALALGLERWDVRPVSARGVPVEGFGLVSGHDGERLSVLVGGLLGHLAAGDVAGAEPLEAAIDAELAREAAAFAALAERPGAELALADLAAVLTHNAGDVVQALTSRSGRPHAAAAHARFGDLARDDGARAPRDGGGRAPRYGGAFLRAAAIYREIGASEGHRHYPLRAVKALRVHPALLLPLGPFLDAWGARLATWPGWGVEQRAEVVAALVSGCRKVPGQAGYHRALAGFERAHPGGLDAPALVRELPAALRRALKDAELRRKVGVSRESFEASARKRVRALLASTAS